MHNVCNYIVQKRALQVLSANLWLLLFPPEGIGRAFVTAFLLLIAPFNARGFDATGASIHVLDLFTSNAQQAANCVDLITNGGFESARLGWTRTVGTSLFSYATNTFVSGRQSLLLGSTDLPGVTATFAAQQLITLPLESTSLELSFYYDVEIEGEASPGDQALLVIYDPRSNQALTTQTLVPSPNGTWATGRYDLSALEGREIGLIFATQNDGEPGRLAMYVDDVSIQACQPLTDLPLALPTGVISTVAPPTPQLLPLLPQMTPPSPQTTPLFPQVGSIDSLAACSCTSSLYVCTDFSNWSVAQACYTLCQVTVGYDIHRLDEDRNGIACELELKDVEPLEATATPQPTPTSINPTSAITPSLIITDLNVTTPTVPPLLNPIVADLVNASPTITDTAIAVTVTETSVVATAVVSAVATVPLTPTPITPTVVTESVAALAPSPTLLALNSTSPSPNTEPSLSSAEIFLSFLFSPFGIFVVAALLTVGLLGLWIAYLLGLRRPTNINNG